MSKRILVYGMTDNPGGIETYLINTMQELNTQGVHFDFLCDFPNIAYEDKILSIGSKTYFIPAKSKGLLDHWKETYKILKNHKEYQTVYFNILDAGAVLTMLIPWLMGRKIVTHSHNGETDKKTLHKLCKPILNFVTNQYLACSKLAAEYMFGKSEKIQKKVVLIPNAIDVEKYKFNAIVRNKKRKEIHVDDTNIVICHVGRLSLQKNPYGMLDIFKEVLKKNNKAILLSIGTGELEEQVKEYASKLEIQDSVKFMGQRFDVAELMQAADVFFLPSFYEGLPIVALEAQASGLQCVLSANITDEVDITGNVRFISLDAPKAEWVNTLLKCASMARNEVQEVLEESEFNIANFEKVLFKLKKCL